MRERIASLWLLGIACAHEGAEPLPRPEEPSEACEAAEVPYDGVDNDCDPESADDDLDADGHLLADDCDDADPSIPTDEMVGNGVDDDCDGAVDCADPDLPAGPTLVWEGDATGPDLVPICRDALTACTRVVVTGSAVLTRTPAGLTCLAEVDGDLTIGLPPPDNGDRRSASEVTSLADLSGLERVGGTLTVQYTELPSLEGLERLTALGGLALSYNEQITTLDGLGPVTSLTGDLYLFANARLASIDALAGLERIGGALYLVSNDLDSLAPLDGLTSVGAIQLVEDVTSLAPLSGLTAVPGRVLVNAPRLTSLEGLEHLSEVGDLLHLVGPITSFEPLAALRSVGGELTIMDSEATSLAGLEGLTSVGALDLSRNDRLTSIEALRGVGPLDALVVWRNPVLTSLAGLDDVTAIAGDVEITDNDALPSLAGLDRVASIGGALHVGGTTWDGDGNDALTSLEGLGALETVGGDLVIDANDALVTTSGLDALREVGGGLRIGGWAEYYVYDELGNDALTDLTPLYGLERVGGRVEITYNTSLGNDAARALVDAIEAVGGPVEVHDNR